MSAEQASAFFVFAVVAAITPGPSNVLLTATGANVGVLRGIPALLGVCLGMASMMFAVAFGLGAVILDHPAVLTVMKWAGAALLLWLAWQIASAKGGGASAESRPIGFLGAAAFQWVNPKAWLACASAAGTYLRADASGALTQSVGFAALFAAATLPSGFVWLAFGTGLRRWLSSPQRMRAFNLAMGALLAASVILFVA
jgi:threonine/homoserine/homoserine lactone efflux protein